MKKRILTIVTMISLCMAFLTGCGNEQVTTTDQDMDTQAENNKETESALADNGIKGAEEDTNTEDLLSGKHHVEITIKDMGVIKVELDADAAPVTVTNFVGLAEEGFYDGLTFHRIIDGFMIQGGDPLGNGRGGSENTIVGEFAGNGIENPLLHTRGAISMARSGYPDSASSQFFIMHEDAPYLDGEYAAFGYVTEGMDIVDTICETTTGQDENGIVPPENQPVIESIKVID